MNAFEYASPTSVEQAVRALAGAESSEGLSGGTDLLCRLKDYISGPDRVVYLKAIADDGFRGVSADGDGLAIGAGTTLAELLGDESIAGKYPAIAQAARSVATPQVRNMATVGGNLLQRPRCWYYRSGFGLLGGRRDSDAQARLVRELEGEYAPYNIDLGGMPEGGHLVRLGDNRYHAIFMTDGNALYVNPSNLAPALIALGAQAEIVGPDGTRTIPVSDLYRVPSQEGERELTISTDEVLTRVLVPPPNGLNAFYEIRQKQSHDWPIVMAAVSVPQVRDPEAKPTVILGGVAPIPYRSEAAEAAINQQLSRDVAEAAGQAATQGAQPLSKNAYKVPLVKTAVKRALLRAAGDEYWSNMEA